MNAFETAALSVENEAAIRAEAQSWHIHLTSGHASAEDVAAFEAWRDSDTRCHLAYEGVAALQAALLTDPTIAAMAQPGAAAGEPVAIDDLNFDQSGVGPLKGAWGSRLWKRITAPAFGGALATAAAVLFAVFLWNSPSPAPAPYAYPVYETAASETRELRLDDGSVVTLAAGSRVEVAFDKGSRLLRLTKGEALFHVAKDKARPFVVVAGNTSVRAVGTRFNVRLSARDVKVDVEEGVVEVFKPAALSSGLTADESAKAVTLRAGEQTVAIVATGVIASPTPSISLSAPAVPKLVTPVETVEAGVRRRYVGVPLSQLVAEANATRRSKIELSSPEVGAMKVTTSFRPGEIDTVIDNLPAILPVRVERTAGGMVVISADE